MRSLRLFAGVLLPLSLLAWVAPAAGQDFDPRGRGRPRPGPARPGPARPGPARPGPARPGPARPGPTAPPPTTSDAQPPGTDQPATNPTAPKVAPSVLIERYARIVLSQPGAPFPLQRLAQLYRDRDGKTEALVKDFETRSEQAGPNQYGAMVALAGLYKIEGRADDAIKTYEKSITLKPTDAGALMALARLLQDRADLPGARSRYEQALAVQTIASERQTTLRTLMTVALDSKDWDGARAYHEKLVTLDRTSLFTKGELGRELFSRGEFERAEVEFRALVAAAAGDNRALAPALKELGRAQAKAGKNDEALVTLRRALAASGAESAVRGELYTIIAEVYRKDQKLPLLIKLLEDERASDFARLVLLGNLYEETGDAVKALAIYRRALAQNPKHLDLRLKTVRLLQSQGEIDRAITEYEALVRAAPNNPAFVFELCEALMQRGDRARALRILTEVEGRIQSDDEALSRIADFYGRIGENDRSVKVLERLAQMSGADPGHVTDLGDRYFQDNNKPMALQTWRRLLTLITPRSKALVALGDVYMEHDMNDEALAMYREAVGLEPTSLVFKRQLATALERTRSSQEARTVWLEIMNKAAETGDRNLVREARSRIVTSWSLDKQLVEQVPRLLEKFRGPPPDLEAGRMLAEAYGYLRKFPDAEAIWRAVIQKAPGDVDAYLALERNLTQQPNKIPETIAVVEKLVEVEPKRAREFYQRLSQYALAAYRDDDAIRYAAKAVELNPDDAEGHRRLGDMYRSRQQTDKAVVEYRAAIARNDRLYLVYFQLAEILLARGESDESERLLRSVIRIAPDDELVSRAARTSLQIHQGRGTLPLLEQELLPLAIANPQRPLFRKLLVEIYGSMTTPLVRTSRGGGAGASVASAELASIGGRAIKPLLDALADPEVSQQRIAIDVLAYVQNRNAAIPLFTYATGPGDSGLRTRAMVASGALRDPQLMSRYEALLFPKDGIDSPFDATSTAAAWSVAHSGQPAAKPLLRRLLTSPAPDLRALAALGLANLGDKAALPLIAPLLDQAAPPATRSAIALALGRLGAQTSAGELGRLARSGDASTARASMFALVQLSLGASGQAKGESSIAIDALCDGLFYAVEGGALAGRESMLARRTARKGLIELQNSAKLDTQNLVPVPDGNLDIGQMVSGLLDAPSEDATTPTAATPASAAAFVRFAPRIEAAARRALAVSPERSSILLDAMQSGSGQFESLVALDGSAESRAAVATMLDNLEPFVVPLTKSSVASLRSRALGFMSRRSSNEAQQILARAALDTDAEVQRMALSSMIAASAGKGAAVSVQAASSVARSHAQWALRLLAVNALGNLAQGTDNAVATAALVEVAHVDKFALVREAAIRALLSVDKARGEKLAAELATTDGEPKVREFAATVAPAASKRKL